MHVKCLLQFLFNTCSANLFVHSTKKKSKVDKIQIGLALKNVRNSDVFALLWKTWRFSQP